MSLLIALSIISILIALVCPWSILRHQTPAFQELILFHLRLPRILAAFAIGGLLSLAGTLLQVQLRNPLADPYIMGVSGGASFFCLAALLLGVTGAWLNASAFVGSLFSMMIIFLLMQSRVAFVGYRLTLLGVLLASGWAALIIFSLTVSNSHHTEGLLFWLMGNLDHVRFPVLLWVILLLGFVGCWMLASTLNVMMGGELQAQALGVSMRRTQRQLFLLSSLFTAVAVSSAGNIGFVGLIIPHILRLWGVTNHKNLLPAVVFLGGSFLVLADLLSRMVLGSQQLPVGVMTALIGVPLCIGLLRR